MYLLIYSANNRQISIPKTMYGIKNILKPDAKTVGEKLTAKEDNIAAPKNNKDIYFRSKLLHFIINIYTNIHNKSINPIITDINGSDTLLSNILRANISELYK